MTEVLLKELSNSDVDWMIATGQQREIAVGTTLIQEGRSADDLHILLDGTLSVTVPVTDKHPLARAFAAIDGSENAGKEIARLSSGEVVGDVPFVGSRATATTVKAVENSLVISIPRQHLATKLQRDAHFAARFYRAIAILLSDRLQNTIHQLSRTSSAQGQPVKDILCVLGELNDSDIDWMLAKGVPQKISARTIIIREGGPIDALYVILNGTMSVTLSEDKRNPLTRAFAAIEGQETLDREIARLSKGEIVGETPFIDARLPFTTVKALEDSFVLSIPRQDLAIKLQQDIGFASRFYRVVASLISDRLQATLSKFGYGRRIYGQGQPLDQNTKYDNELDINVLDRISLAGTRFDWMLANVKGT